MQNNKTIIEFKNIVKIYGKGDAKTYALDNVNLLIKEGEFVAIMGASGSGKSTAMNMIGSLDLPSSGEYLFNGINVEKLNKNQMAFLRRNYLGFLFQGFNLLGRTSTLENVELPLLYRKVPAKQRKEMALAALKTVGLESVSNHTPTDNFHIRDMEDLLLTMTSTTKMLTYLLGSIAGISLLVGGIGIMNIMLVSVTERTKEIGIRLAIGAMANEVLLQFLVEAIVLSTLGGIIGIGYVTVNMLDLAFIINEQIIIISFAFSTLIGVFFGYFPARKAAKLNSIDALRYE